MLASSNMCPKSYLAVVVFERPLHWNTNVELLCTLYAAFIGLIHNISSGGCVRDWDSVLYTEPACFWVYTVLKYSLLFTEREVSTVIEKWVYQCSWMKVLWALWIGGGEWERQLSEGRSMTNLAGSHLFSHTNNVICCWFIIPLFCAGWSPNWFRILCVFAFSVDLSLQTSLMDKPNLNWHGKIKLILYVRKNFKFKWNKRIFICSQIIMKHHSTTIYNYWT